MHLHAQHPAHATVARRQHVSPIGCALVQVSGDSVDRPWTLLTGFAAENVTGLVRDVTVLITSGPAVLTALGPAAFFSLYLIGAASAPAVGASHTTLCQVHNPDGS